ncbi:MAG: right-handed parallel beta-helix repeat-containing protein [Armatimonadota bacterium]
MKRLVIVLICLVFVSPHHAVAAEYFVSTAGDDAADGTSVETAVRTVGQGLTLLTPGDTLTIMPGEYFEANEVRLSGTPEAPITIRAARPGTVLLRGDVDLRGFEPVSGTRYTWMADFDREVEGVGEKDTFASYAFVASVPEVEEVRGSCYYDADAQRLYVHTSDSAPADAHALSVSVTNGFGLIFLRPDGEENVHDIIIDGIAATGYRNREIAPLPGSNTRWGIYIVEGERCTIRRCTAFLNGGGISIVRPIDCLIEYCHAFGNYSTYNSSGGNIICWSPATDTVQRHNIVHDTKSNGIRFYGGGTENCALEDNLAWDCAYGEIWIKGGDNETSRIVRNAARGAIYNSGGVARENMHHNLGSYASNIEDETNIWFSKIPRFDFDANFVDPINHDYRLQSDAPLRGTGPDGADPGPHPYEGNVFFVSPDGDDAADGTSIAKAWRTIAHAAEAARPGQTVYLLAGVYNETLRPARSGTADAPIEFRRRGRDRVVLDGQGQADVGVLIDGLSQIAVDGLTVTGFTGAGVSASAGEAIALSDCVLTGNGAGAVATGFADLSVTNCLFRDNAAGGLLLEEGAAPGAEVASNVFDRNGGAALAMDAAVAEISWSDYNAFEPDARAMLADATLDLDGWREATGLDAHSLSHTPEYRDADAGDFDLEDGSLLPGRGMLAANIGPYHRDEVQAPLRIEGVEVHSVTATTANIEWWTPTAEATTKLEWGPTPECENVIENIYDASIFHTVSLTGLEPGTRYFFRVSATAPATEFHTNVDLARLEDEKQREIAAGEVAQFETPAQDPPARTLYVAIDGDDSADGLSAASAWRTLRHAAGEVRAGDTVLIHEGTYQEHVPIRATGDDGAPITFRAAPGEKVWLDGSGQKRPTAITLAHKSHIRLDGLYLRNFRASRYEAATNTGAFRIVGGSDNTISRCFYDGRAKTYMPFFVEGRETERLTIENCVVINGWNGSSFRACPELTIRNSVYYNGLIRALTVHNEPHEPMTLTHNIMCDNVPGKVRNATTYIWHIEALQADHNCYFMRVPAEEKPLVGWARIGGELIRDEVTLPELRERFGLETHAVYANPGMPVVEELSAPDGDDAEYKRIEMHREGDEMQPLDFADFFADPAGPAAQAADGRPIGLDPAAFED